MGVLFYYVRTLTFLEPKGPDHSNHLFLPRAYVGIEAQKKRGSDTQDHSADLGPTLSSLAVTGCLFPERNLCDG